MYELIILSLLMQHPMHGYLIASIINDIIGPYARFSNGRLYPMLARLEEAGLIVMEKEREGSGAADYGRPVHTYRITEEGRRRFHVLMLDTSSNPGEYPRIFEQKVASFEFLTLTERLHLIEHYLNYSQAHILHLKSEAEDLKQKHSQYGPKMFRLLATLDVIEHRIRQWQLEVEWAEDLRDKALVDVDQLEKTNRQ